MSNKNNVCPLKMSNPKVEESRQSYLDKNPFEGLKINDNSVLDKLEGRHPCPKCGKSRKFYCYSCYVPILELQGKLPTVQVGIHLHFVMSSYITLIFSCQLRLT